MKFSTLDLSHAYQQMELEQESKNLLTFNRLDVRLDLPFGYNRLPVYFKGLLESAKRNSEQSCMRE